MQHTLGESLGLGMTALEACRAARLQPSVPSFSQDTADCAAPDLMQRPARAPRMSVGPCKSVDASPCPGRGVTRLMTAVALMSPAPEADAVLGSFGISQPARASDVRLVADESPAPACIHPYFNHSLTVSSVASLLVNDLLSWHSGGS